MTKLILDPKNWHQKLETSVFRQSSIKVLQNIRKIFKDVSFDAKVFFEFYTPYYEIPQLSSRYFVLLKSDTKEMDM